MSNIQEALKECDEISSDVMNIVGNSLTDNGIEYSSLSDSEFVIDGERKNEIRDIISNNTEIDFSNAKIILQISESNNKTFIRQKFN
jgi:hypothetical protein